MNANRLKGIACVSMLLDHIGFLLLPWEGWLRWCGRLALPIFAYLIAEGCRHTRNRKQYFLRLLGLGLLCQLATVGEALLYGATNRIVLNILITLSAAQLVCFTWLDFVDAYRLRQGQSRAAIRFLLTIAGVAVAVKLGTALAPVTGVMVTFDYGLTGLLLPWFALLFSSRRLQLLSFGVGIVFVCLSLYPAMPFVWLSLLSLPLLALYNGQRGSRRWKYAFYAFYPMHFAVIYGIRQFM